MSSSLLTPEITSKKMIVFKSSAPTGGLIAKSDK